MQKFHGFQQVISNGFLINCGIYDSYKATVTFPHSFREITYKTFLSPLKKTSGSDGTGGIWWHTSNRTETSAEFYLISGGSQMFGDSTNWLAVGYQ